MLGDKIKEIQARIKSVVTRRDDNVSVSIFYETTGESWGAWVDIIDSWRTYSCRSLSVEAGSYEDAVLALHNKVMNLKKIEIKKSIREICRG